MNYAQPLPPITVHRSLLPLNTSNLSPPDHFPRILPMQPPEPAPTPRRTPDGPADGFGSVPVLSVLTLQAFQLRSQLHHALHPVEAALQYHRAAAQGSGAPCDAAVGFEQAESHYRAGAQGLRLSEIPQLPQQLRQLSALENNPLKSSGAPECMASPRMVSVTVILP